MNGKYLAAGVILTFVLVSGVVAARSFTASEDNTDASVSAGKMKGRPDAPVTIVEYSDFQCPACRSAQDVLQRFLTQYPDTVKVVYKHFPLSGHQWAPMAHQAAECAHLQGRFWEYHDLLYSKQAEWSLPVNPAPKFMTYAQQAGLNLDQFAACLSDDAVRSSIHTEKKEGQDRQVSSTPTFFVNDQRIVGHIQLASQGQKIIEAAEGNAPSTPAASNE